jgi:hypothetical protein
MTTLEVGLGLDEVVRVEVAAVVLAVAVLTFFPASM